MKLKKEEFKEEFLDFVFLIRKEKQFPHCLNQ